MPVYSMSCTDAESYLKTVGINPPPSNYPEYELVHVRYSDPDPKTGKPKEGKETRGIINGACFQFEVDDDTFLQKEPMVKSARKGMKTTIMMIDPDAPDRANLEGNAPGAMGPYLHWLAVDCIETVKSGDVKQSYMGPAPPQGKHRYIFVEFEQAEDTPVVVPSVERASWDIKGFLAANPKLKAVAMNYYYCSKDRESAAGKPNCPRKNGTACDKEWYPLNPKWTDEEADRR